MKILPVLALAVLSLGAQAADEVYRWVDKDGVIHYGAQPPSKDAKPAALPNIQTYSNRSANKQLPLAPLEAATKASAAGAAAVAVKEVRILAPVQDEIFRDPGAGVSVSVAVLPGLPEGAGVVFYLDGTPRSAKPSPSLSTNFGSVDRGEHSVTAAVVDASGKELGRAAAVTFHSKPPGGLK